MGLQDRLPTPPPPPPQSGKQNPEDEGVFERIYEGHAEESTDSNLRYAGYAARFRTILNATHRYVAYTSDIGESFRPVTHPYAVKAAYGISWLYLGGDVGYEGYKAYLRNKQKILELKQLQDSTTTSATASSPSLPSTISQDKPVFPPSQKDIPFHEDYRTVMAQRAIFQTLASMAFPAFTIHSIVKYSGKAMRNIKNVRVRTWGPVGLGLSVVPALPFVFDEPVEKGVDWVFEKGYEVYAGGKGKKVEESKKEL